MFKNRQGDRFDEFQATSSTDQSQCLTKTGIVSLRDTNRTKLIHKKRIKNLDKYSDSPSLPDFSLVCQLVFFSFSFILNLSCLFYLSCRKPLWMF